MPSAIKTARQYAGDVAVLFVESQGSNQTQSDAFAWKQKWMGTSAIWTTERPFNTGANGIPNFVLLSANGEVLLKGNPLALHSKIEELLEEELKSLGDGPKDAHKDLRKVYKTRAKGKLADALAEAREIEAAGGEASEDAKALASEIERSIEARFARVDYMLENGYVLEAEELVDQLSKGLKGSEAHAEALAKAEAAVDAADSKTAKAFAKIEEKLMADGPDDGHMKKLAKFVEKEEGPVAERAKRLLQLLQAEDAAK